MTMRDGSISGPGADRPTVSGAGAPDRRRSDPGSLRPGRFWPACSAAAGPLLASCGSSGAGLIPAQNAGPLQSDFDAVAQAAEKGNGSCAATEEAILKTEQDFSALPATVDAGLRSRLREGITKLHSDALELCKQPLAGDDRHEHVDEDDPDHDATTTRRPTVTQPTTTPARPPRRPLPLHRARAAAPRRRARRAAKASRGGLRTGRRRGAGARRRAGPAAQGAGAGGQEGGK